MYYDEIRKALESAKKGSIDALKNYLRNEKDRIARTKDDPLKSEKFEAITDFETFLDEYQRKNWHFRS